MHPFVPEQVWRARSLRDDALWTWIAAKLALRRDVGCLLGIVRNNVAKDEEWSCLLYTSPSPRDSTSS
eukprot:11875918-Prorocentrum_lima.AAC.1